jgi:hypothetical protein
VWLTTTPALRTVLTDKDVPVNHWTGISPARAFEQEETEETEFRLVLCSLRFLLFKVSGHTRISKNAMPKK